jgi:DNA-binding MarR family transcriptional regulator
MQNWSNKQTTKRARTGKRKLVTQVIRDAREYSIGTASFHQAVGRILGLNVTDMKCLDVMTMRGVATPSQLAEHTGLSSGATTSMIDRLEKAGLSSDILIPKIGATRSWF